MPVVAGGGPRCSAPWGSTAEVSPRRGGPAAGAPGLERGPAGVGGGRSPAACGAGRWPRAAAGVRGREGGVSCLPRTGRKSSADSLPAPREAESPPPVLRGRGVCVCMKMETLNKCCGNFLHYYSFGGDELSLTQPCVQVAVLSSGIYVNVANRLSFPVVCLLEYSRGTSVCGLM